MGGKPDLLCCNGHLLIVLSRSLEKHSSNPPLSLHLFGTRLQACIPIRPFCWDLPRVLHIAFVHLSEVRNAQTLLHSWPPWACLGISLAMVMETDGLCGRLFLPGRPRQTYRNIIITMVVVRLTNDISIFLVHRLPLPCDDGCAVLNKDPLEVTKSSKGPSVTKTWPFVRHHSAMFLD